MPDVQEEVVASDPPPVPYWSSVHKYHQKDEGDQSNYAHCLHLPDPCGRPLLATNPFISGEEPDSAIIQAMEQFESSVQDACFVSTLEENDVTRSTSKRKGSNGEGTASGGIGDSIRRKFKVVKTAASNEIASRTRNFRGPTFSVKRISNNSIAVASPPPLSSPLSPSIASSGRAFPNRKVHHRPRSEVFSVRPHTALRSPQTFDLSLSRELSSPRSGTSELVLSPINSRMPSNDVTHRRPESPSFGVSQLPSAAEITVPMVLRYGVQMIKVSAKKQKRNVFRIDPDEGHIVWESKKLRISECPQSFLARKNPLIWHSTYREYQRTSSRLRRTILQRTVSTFAGVRGSVAHYSLHSRRGLQDFTSHSCYPRNVSTVGLHVETTAFSSSGIDLRIGTRRSPGSDLGASTMERRRGRR